MKDVVSVALDGFDGEDDGVAAELVAGGVFVGDLGLVAAVDDHALEAGQTREVRALSEVVGPCGNRRRAFRVSVPASLSKKGRRVWRQECGKRETHYQLRQLNPACGSLDRLLKLHKCKPLHQELNYGPDSASSLTSLYLGGGKEERKGGKEERSRYLACEEEGVVGGESGSLTDVEVAGAEVVLASGDPGNVAAAAECEGALVDAGVEGGAAGDGSTDGEGGVEVVRVPVRHNRGEAHLNPRPSIGRENQHRFRGV